jgi:hypothetical protein
LIDGAEERVGSKLLDALEASVGVLPFKVNEKGGEGVRAAERVGCPDIDPAGVKGVEFREV